MYAASLYKITSVLGHQSGWSATAHAFHMHTYMYMSWSYANNPTCFNPPCNQFSLTRHSVWSLESISHNEKLHSNDGKVWRYVSFTNFLLINEPLCPIAWLQPTRFDQETWKESEPACRREYTSWCHKWPTDGNFPTVHSLIFSLLIVHAGTW